MKQEWVEPVWGKEKGVGEHLPYSAQLDSRTILLRDGRLMQVIELEGIHFETLDSEELDYRKTLRDATVKALGTSRFALYQHVVRRQVDPTLEGEFPDEFTARLDRRWRERLDRKALYSNQLFLCVILRPLQGRGGKVSLFGRLFRSATASEREAMLREDQAKLDAAVDALEASLSGYGARVLESYEHEGTLFATKGAEQSSTTDFEQYGFDLNGNVTSFRTRAGETLAMGYDALNRLTSKIVPERSGLASHATLDVYYAYDLINNLTSARFWGQSSGQGLTFEYDGLGRQVEEKRFGLGSTDTTILSGYDPKTNQRTSLTYPDGKVATYSYDIMGRPSTIQINGVNVAKYTYRQDGLPDKIHRWRDNGTWDMPTGFAFDAQSRMSGLSHNPTGTATDASASFARNPVGQIFQRTQSNGAYVHPAPSDSEFAYTANGLNQYNQADSVSFTYDANGNLTSDGAGTFVYDVENRLVIRPCTWVELRRI